MKDNFVATITAKELKELRRVFDELCFFADKAPKKQRLEEIHQKLAEIKRPKDEFSTVESQKIASLTEEKIRLNEEIKEIKSKPEQYIRAPDAGIAMKVLGKRMKKREIDELIWEIDEKIDGVIDWEEFNLMFERNVRDVSGLEPSGFYYMVQFMIYDRDGNGMVSIDETMNMLYARVGRSKMEESITKLFGGADGAPIKEVGHQGGEINFERFWIVSEDEQMKMFNASELGRALAEKRKKKDGK